MCEEAGEVLLMLRLEEDGGLSVVDARNVRGLESGLATYRITGLYISALDLPCLKREFC